ncbi:hypothetical protein NDU88_011948 [Pleurodeles waltl]|uniref:Uncharacterized protein n=1 Tax=Pleurodeles waltl TaxID=8319 RepID=A0AAV7S5W8_PLEWA|nr:hypothetical protein NDU88_011948 [Pleurodeles waltl]
MGNRTLRDLCWDLRHFLVSIHLENLAVKRSLLQALRHSPPAGQLLNRHPKAPPSRTKTHSGSPDAPLLWQQRWSQRSSRLSRCQLLQLTRGVGARAGEEASVLCLLSRAFTDSPQGSRYHGLESQAGALASGGNRKEKWIKCC